MMQTDKSATLSTHNTQTLFDPIPIADKATRYRAAEIPETMTALPMDLVSENREHLPTHSRPQTGTE